MTETKFDEWAILELMGHRRLAGRVSEAILAGGAFLRIDIPGKDGQQTTQFYSPGSVYCVSPTSEEIARAVALRWQPDPVHRWELHWPSATVLNAARISGVRICRVCGCSEDHACRTADGPCRWVEPDLCSACAPGGAAAGRETIPEED